MKPKIVNFGDLFIDLYAVEGWFAFAESAVVDSRTLHIYMRSGITHKIKDHKVKIATYIEDLEKLSVYF